MLTANVQSLSPKIDELIALLEVENFDVIGLNETWLDTENKNLLAEDAIHGYKDFHVDKQTSTGSGGRSIMYVKNKLNPKERKSSATCTREIIQVDINPKNVVLNCYMHVNIKITAVDDDEFYILISQKMNKSSWVLIFQTYIGHYRDQFLHSATN